MNETNDKTALEIDYNNTKRIKVSVQDLGYVKKLLRDIEKSNGVWNESYKEILLIGQTYSAILRNEFVDDFEDEAKFDHDFKDELSLMPKTTRSYFQKMEIDRLNKIDRIIKDCFRDSDFYRLNKHYVGMCSYLEFLENYKPTSNLKAEHVNRQTNSEKTIIKSFGIYLDSLPTTISNALSELDPEKLQNPFFMGVETKEGNFFCQNSDYSLFIEKYNTQEKLQEIETLLETYKKGYDIGYNSFLDTVKSQVTEIFNKDDESSSRAIYIRTKGKRGFINECFYKNITNERCYEFGKLAGEYYKAWEVIVKNPSRFEKFFIDENCNSESYLKTNYSQIARNLIANKYPIMVKGATCETFEDYIEEERKHCSDPNFYKTLLRVMGEVCSQKKQGNYDTGLDAFISARFNEVLSYCTSKTQPVQPLQPNFDTNNETNPLIFDYQLIVDLHRDFSNYLWTTIDIDNFKNYFRKLPKSIQFNDNITIPEICYFFGKIEHKQVGVSSFQVWMKNHIGKNNYGKNKKELERITYDVKEKGKSNFSLTSPQQKALENKQKIDELFNRILSN